MALYHFNIRNGMGFVPDEEGRELPGLDAAHGEAIDGIRSLISDEARKGLIDLTGKIEIADATGNILAQVGYAEAIELRLPERPSD